MLILSIKSSTQKSSQESTASTKLILVLFTLLWPSTQTKPKLDNNIWYLVKTSKNKRGATYNSIQMLSSLIVFLLQETCIHHLYQAKESLDSHMSLIFSHKSSSASLSTCAQQDCLNTQDLWAAILSRDVHEETRRRGQNGHKSSKEEAQKVFQCTEDTYKLWLQVSFPMTVKHFWRASLFYFSNINTPKKWNQN